MAMEWSKFFATDDWFHIRLGVSLGGGIMFWDPVTVMLENSLVSDNIQRMEERASTAPVCR